MTSTDSYIARVLDQLPRDGAMREQIALELRGHIAERLDHGVAEGEVLQQLGDPTLLAESYLSAIPLEPGSLVARGLAKLVDLALAVAFTAVAALLGLALLWLAGRPEYWPFAMAEGIIVGALGFLIYTIVAEARQGATLGKRWLRLHVVRESGGPIGAGQAIVRQLPWMLQIVWIDVLFALFTDRRQRTFELLSKTRVVAR
jgi:uncharacterized RDD family membrane protein YckC